jgi:hypothetical protein
MDRASLEVVLIRRCATALQMVDLDYQTVSGTNEDLNDAIWTALKRLGYTVADPTAITDAEVEAVEADYQAALIDLAEIRVLETVQNAAVSLVDISVGPRKESLSQFSERIESMIERKRKQAMDDHGALITSGVTLEAGTFSVSFLEDGTNEY